MTTGAHGILVGTTEFMHWCDMSALELTAELTSSMKFNFIIGSIKNLKPKISEKCYALDLLTTRCEPLLGCPPFINNAF